MQNQVAVVTASTGVGEAELASVRALFEQSGAIVGVIRQLGDYAAEFPVDMPDGVALPVVDGLDTNLIPLQNREKKLLIADMDSTIIGVECIDELADFAGVKPQVAAITERAMLGELDFEGALIERVALLEGLAETALQQCYEERVRLNPGAEALVQTMRARGAMTALVSGGFTFFSSRVGAVAGFAFNNANQFEIVDGYLTGKVILPILGRQAKLDTLNRFCAEMQIGQDAVLAIGDGANDLGMINAAGLGVAYHAKPAVAEAADVSLNFSDLRAVLALQGIAEADYVSSSS